MIKLAFALVAMVAVATPALSANEKAASKLQRLAFGDRPLDSCPARSQPNKCYDCKCDTFNGERICTWIMRQGCNP